MAGVYLKSLTRSEIIGILESIDTILSGCDGVLWVGQTAIKGVPRTISRCKSIGKRVLYVTNNAGLTREKFAKKMQNLGYEVEVDEIICMSYLIATYLKSINFRKKVYIIGAEGIGEELDAFGIPHTGIGPEICNTDINGLIANFVPDPEIGAVVVALDTDISYPKLLRAASYLHDPNVLLIASSTDPYVTIADQRFPGPGALVKCIEACSARKAIVLGKPEQYMKQAVINIFEVSPRRTLYIGDSIRADILLGKRCGMRTLLVMTGITTEKYRKELADSTFVEKKELLPDFYTDSIADLRRYL